MSVIFHFLSYKFVPWFYLSARHILNYCMLTKNNLSLIRRHEINWKFDNIYIRDWWNVFHFRERLFVDIKNLTDTSSARLYSIEPKVVNFVYVIFYNFSFSHLYSLMYFTVSFLWDSHIKKIKRLVVYICKTLIRFRIKTTCRLRDRLEVDKWGRLPFSMCCEKRYLCGYVLANFVFRIRILNETNRKLGTTWNV